MKILAVIGRAGALAASAWALIATSAPYCAERAGGPAVFRAEPGCGPGGLVVVHMADLSRDEAQVDNESALGVRSAYWTTRYACPPNLARGDWAAPQAERIAGHDAGAEAAGPDASGDALVPADTDTGVVSDGGRDASAPNNPRTSSDDTYLSCRNQVAGGVLLFSCTNGRGQEVCVSRLVPLP